VGRRIAGRCLVSAAGFTTVLAQDQPASQSSPAAQHQRSNPNHSGRQAHPFRKQQGRPARENQQARIAQGVKSGQLTPAETAKLRKTAENNS